MPTYETRDTSTMVDVPPEALAKRPLPLPVKQPPAKKAPVPTAAKLGPKTVWIPNDEGVWEEVECKAMPKPKAKAMP